MVWSKLAIAAAGGLIAATAVQSIAVAQDYYYARPHGWHERARWHERERWAVEDPYGGPSVIASRPVPDTRFNRARFGEPLSISGRMTPPTGD
jgi:hypothetical protein